MTSIRSATFPRSVRDPAIVGGEPVIEGTRVPVRSLVIIYRLYGDEARVLKAFPHVSRAAVEEALAYYEANREEIDRDIAENEAIATGHDRAED
jgi:uncharacterized protein (DUF433 family)